MAVKKILARGWKFEVETAVPGTYAEIKGVNTFSVSPSKNDADTTTFDDQGAESHLVASRGKEITLEGFHLEDPANGARDPGQERVEVLADLIGENSLGNFRMTSPGNKIWNFSASFDVEGPGGGNNDAASWQCTVKVSGIITKA